METQKSYIICTRSHSLKALIEPVLLTKRVYAKSLQSCLSLCNPMDCS